MKQALRRKLGNLRGGSQATSYWSISYQAQCCGGPAVVCPSDPQGVHVTLINPTPDIATVYNGIKIAVLPSYSKQTSAKCDCIE